MKRTIKQILLIIIGCLATIRCSGNDSAVKPDDKSTYTIPEGVPGIIRTSLAEDRVFHTPEFNYTTKYDEHNSFSNVRGLFFDGLDYHGKQTKVFCWYGVPTSLKKGSKAPAVVCVHGGGGTAFSQWVKKWNDQGYIAIAIALEGQVPGERNAERDIDMKWPQFELSGPYRQGFFLDVMNEELRNQWFYHAVSDIILANSLLRSFPEVDNTKIGITGISWGGILTNVVTGIDNRFAFAIPVYGCGYLHETPTYIKQLEAHTPISKQFYLENWEPSLYVPLQKQPTLFVDGTNDGHFSMNSFTKTYQASSAEKYLHVEYEMKHGHVAGWNPEEIYQFADYVTNGGQAPVAFALKKENNAVGFEGEISKVFTYYATDTADWSAKSYKWIKTESQLSKSNKTIHSELPEEAQYFFINGIDENGMMYSSPMFKVE